MLRISEEVREALEAGGPVVALETTIVAHGFPPGEGIEVGRECEARLRAVGAVPATTAVLDGELRVGLSADELERIASAGVEALKAGPRDILIRISAANRGFAASRKPYDVWFKDECKKVFIPEIDFNDPLPPIEVIWDWEATKVAR